MNICSDKSYSTMEMAKKILKVLNKKNLKIKKTVLLEKKLNPKILDNNKMKKLDFSVDNRKINYYLKETVKWYKENI